MKPLYIYNLFPLLCGPIQAWERRLDAIAAMGFNSIYLNPFHETGASGSIYSVRDHYRYNPQLSSDPRRAEREMQHFLAECRRRGLDIFMDLVVNHSAIDSPLVGSHPDWYVRDHCGAIVRPQKLHDWNWVTWEDLAKFAFDTSADKDALWNYFLDVGRHYLSLGFSGLRCDAADHVSVSFWAFLIENLKRSFPSAIFLAETFLCPPDQIRTLVGCGFDYIFNSAKWWNFEDAWCLEQYEATHRITPSISFPESHDTVRLMEEVHGSEAAFLQRVHFAAVFSKGFMIVSGLENGLRTQLDCVITDPAHWESTGQDYSDRLAAILSIKKALRPLHEESPIALVAQNNPRLLCFVKKWQETSVLVVLNKDVERAQALRLCDVPHLLGADRIIDYSPGGRSHGYLTNLQLDVPPGAVKLFVGESHVMSSHARGGQSG